MLAQRVFTEKMFCRWTVFALFAIMLAISGCSDDESDPISPASVPPELVVSPQSVVLSGYEGAVSFEQVHIRVDCEPYDNIAFSFNCQSSWTILSNLEGTDCGITRDSFSISFDVADLAPGEYVGLVRVSSEEVSNSPQHVEVTYNVIPLPPDMVVVPNRLTFITPSIYDELSPGSLRVVCADGSIRSYAMEESADWISLSVYSDVTPSTVEVMIDMSNLVTGSHQDTIWVTSEQMSGSPIAVVCDLITPPWQLQEYAYDTYILEDIAFADENTGWAVGYISAGTYSRPGYVMETFDGGATWVWVQQLFLNAGFEEDSAFVAVETAGSRAWALVKPGVLYTSQDLGVTWQRSTIGLPTPEIQLKGMEFITPDIGWIIGTDGLILKTENGGDNWVEQTSHTTEDLLAICFVDESHGWVIGYHNVLLFTSDGGDTWQGHEEGFEGPLTNCRDIFFCDVNTGWIVGSAGDIWHTSNGGVSWVPQESGVGVWLHSVWFADGATGWVVGQDGIVLHSTDGGESWTLQESGTTSVLYSVFFLNESRGWFAGDHGEIRFTSSAGF